jgi:creatinine amidohydrolase
VSWPRALLALVVVLACCSARAVEPLHLEELTWTELRDRIAAGDTVALVPIGGTEQNGPHMALGKHNARAKQLAERIARRLGNAIVAPVLAYTPNGGINPPTEHMRWPGTVSVPAPAFEATLEGAALSLLRAGFKHVVLLGDSGNYRASLDRVAGKLDGVHALPQYYHAATEGYARLLRERGHSDADTGRHAGLADTSLLLAIDAALVRAEAARQLQPHAQGISGNPHQASVALGELGVDHIVEQSVRAIQALAAQPPKPQSRPK